MRKKSETSTKVMTCVRLPEALILEAKIYGLKEKKLLQDLIAEGLQMRITSTKRKESKE
jgi:hypothetical protein